MNTKQRKQLMIFMMPYVILIVAVILVFAMMSGFSLSEEYMLLYMLPTLILSMALLILIAIAMLACDIFYLRLHLEREL